MANDEDLRNKASNKVGGAANTPAGNTGSASDGTTTPAAPAKTNEQRPEPNVEPTPTFRADMGEGLPPQKDQLNPDRAK